MVDAKPILAPSLRIGAMQVDATGVTLRTLLGSCVGLALYDRRQAIGGLAHVLLPDSNGKTQQPGRFVDTAIPCLVDQMKKIATKPLQLTATIAGGASMFSSGSVILIGQQNVQACRSSLAQWKIPIAAEHCGGEKGRRMSLQTDSGIVLIEIAGQPTIQLSPNPRNVR
ncbi:MAG: chemotaxis protein CheD [Planctomycetota bacterium]